MGGNARYGRIACAAGLTHSSTRVFDEAQWLRNNTSIMLATTPFPLMTQLANEIGCEGRSMTHPCLHKPLSSARPVSQIDDDYVITILVVNALVKYSLCSCLSRSFMIGGGGSHNIDAAIPRRYIYANFLCRLLFVLARLSRLSSSLSSLASTTGYAFDDPNPNFPPSLLLFAPIP